MLSLPEHFGTSDREKNAMYNLEQVALICYML